jgi:translation initiation factor IF-2
VADIAVLVVSAEDGVKPQTIEALNCINKDSMPFIVALNKIDKANANIDKIKQNLAENNILVEGWGGSIPLVPVSAKTGAGVPELLEIITLQSDLEELEGDKDIPAKGFVIESNLSPKQGISATVIIKDGTLKLGMFVATEGSLSPVRSMENYRGEKIIEAEFSSPVKITGWDKLPLVGSHFKTFYSKEDAIKFSETKSVDGTKDSVETAQEGRAILPIIIKADAYGSLEGIEHEIQKLGNDKIVAKSVSKGIGSISETDVKTAHIKNSLILGFNVAPEKNAEALALRTGVQVKTFSVIYDIVDFIKEKLKTEAPVSVVEVITGSTKILRIFSKNKDKQVVGGRVDEGEIKSGSSVKIWRRDNLIGEGKIKELQSQKIKTSVVKEGEEFGMMIESKIELVQGDILKATSLQKQE